MKTASIITAVCTPIKETHDLAYWYQEMQLLSKAIDCYPKLEQYRAVRLQMANIAKQIQKLEKVK